jgi:YHS domain-containing protein
LKANFGFQNNAMKKFVFVALVCLLAQAGQSQVKFFEKDSLAILGYDPVAYFTQSKAVKGDPGISHRWQGVTWLFSSPEHKTAFISNPESYAPQFGGFCAYGASEQHLSPTDPEAWTIHQSRLYLNYSKKVKSIWLPDTTKRIPAAEAYWKTIK